MLQKRGEEAQNQHNLDKRQWRIKDKSENRGHSDCREDGDDEPMICR